MSKVGDAAPAVYSGTRKRGCCVVILMALVMSAGCMRPPAGASPGATSRSANTAAGPATAVSTSAVSSSAPSSTRQLVIIEDGLNVEAVDPNTGAVVWRQGLPGGARSAVAPGRPGLLFLSVEPPGGGSDLFGVSLPAGTSALLQHFSSHVRVGHVAADGTRLYAVRFATATSAEPDGVLTVPLAAPWRGSPGSAGSDRDAGAGVLSRDGSRWFGLRVEQSADPEWTATLHAVNFHAADPPTAATLPVPTQFGYTYPLLAPDQRHLYVVDFPERVHVVAVSPPREVRSATIRTDGRKAASCSSDLAPQANRLYVAVPPPGQQGDGIDVIDLGSLRRVARFLPGATIYCLAVAPDGAALYATSGSNLLTLDPATGRIEHSVPVADANNTLPLGFAVAVP